MTFFETIKAKNNYTIEQENCINKIVSEFLIPSSEENKPAMLFGEIQSGKTRTFIGIIAAAFDNNYDICVVLTKNTIALAEQTYKRFDNNFQEIIDDGFVTVYDIMQLPTQIGGGILNKKLVFIVKKQKDNLNRLVKLFEKYERLQKKKVLFVDDEADFGSIGFKRDTKQDDGVSANVIMSKINAIRKQLSENYTFLQVTATPYCLYLQPDGVTKVNNNLYHPNRPTITALVPNHSKYIGGKYYFEESENQLSPASQMFKELSVKELKKFNSKDSASLIPNHTELIVFKQSIVNYIIGSCIRIIQTRKEAKRYKTSFLIHIDKAIKTHNSQYDLTFKFINLLRDSFTNPNKDISSFFIESYNEFKSSIELTRYEIPSFEKVIKECEKILNDEDINIITVNSEQEVKNLLDRNGQLRLDTPLNIFIGGDVLDRGITIENMIGFFYGRSPQIFQQDTVLQHSRMYGARNREDLVVTRLYTTARIYLAMKQMYEFDTELREAFLKGKNNDGVVFVNSDFSKGIRPCSPNKLLISTTTTIKPLKRFLPIGFNSKSKGANTEHYEEIISILKSYKTVKGKNSYIEITLSDFINVAVTINRMLDYSENKDYKWDISSFIAIAKQTCTNNKIHCFIKWNRNVSRLKFNGQKFQDSPEDGNVDLPEAKNMAVETPTLILLHQEGKKENGWIGDYNFFWPVMITPKNTQPAIFASEAE